MNLRERLISKGEIKLKPVTIKYSDGSEECAFVKPYTAKEYQDSVAFAKSLMIKKDGADVVNYSRLRESSAYIISTQLVDEKGSQVLSIDDIMLMDDSAVEAMVKAIKSLEQKNVEDVAKN
jgi:predicted  nucleic acid-binding Zn-ribbon protein